MGGTILYHIAVGEFSSLRGEKYASKPATMTKMIITIAIFMIFFDFNGCTFQTLMLALQNSFLCHCCSPMGTHRYYPIFYTKYTSTKYKQNLYKSRAKPAGTGNRIFAELFTISGYNILIGMEVTYEPFKR